LSYNNLVDVKNAAVELIQILTPPPNPPAPLGQARAGPLSKGEGQPLRFGPF